MYRLKCTEAWPNVSIVQKAVGQLPLGRKVMLLTHFKYVYQRVVQALRRLRTVGAGQSPVIHQAYEYPDIRV